MRRCSVFRPRQGEEAVERALHRADRVLQERDLLGEFGVVADHEHAADHVRMAVEVFRRRMHDQVGAVFEQALQRRRGEGVVDRDQQAALLRDSRDRGDVDDLQQRVGRVSIHTSFVLGVIAASNFAGSVMSTKLKSRPALRRRTRSNGGSCRRRVVHREHVVAAVEQFQQRGGGREPGCEREPAAAAFQTGDAALVGEAGRVVRARYSKPWCTPGLDWA